MTPAVDVHEVDMNTRVNLCHAISLNDQLADSEDLLYHLLGHI